MFSTECMRMRGFRKQYWISWKLFIFVSTTLDLDNFRFIQVDFIADGGFLLIINIGFRKFWWISWIAIFRPTGFKAEVLC